MLKQTLCAIALAATALSSQAAIISEGFVDVSTLTSKGFILRNDSSPAGPLFPAYTQGGSGFDAQEGPADSYLGMNYNVGDVGGTLNNWLITPLFTTTEDLGVSFWVQGATDPNYLDQFAYGFSNGGTDAADFLLSSVQTATQGVWTQITAGFTGTGIAGTTARFGIVYTGSADRANAIGFDTLEVPEPASMMLVGLGLAGLVAARRRQGA
ncbi:MAG: hypothetical protein JWP59_2669 [Massilia sp.]|jgi:hypothetical protein|nr:hypothetical protein [Massilia sp.]